MTVAAIAVGVVVLGMLAAGFVVASGRRGEVERAEKLEKDILAATLERVL